jgi:serine protease Do
MYRGLIISLSLFLLWAPVLAAQDRSPPKDVPALQEAIQQVIQRAEPSVASILVSRSDAYSRLFKDSPPPENPGRLGGFERRPVPPMVPERPFGGRRRGFFRGEFGPRRDENAKYDLADRDYVPEAYGSGVVLDVDQSLIVTNYHVIVDATKIYVRLPSGKGSYADIHAADPRSDLAVLRLIDPAALRPTDSSARLKPIPLGDGTVKKGEFVVALSNPFAAAFRDGSPSASWGIVSNVRRAAAGNPREEEEKAQQVARSRMLLPFYTTLVQTDARLDASCSGGALVNLRGELIGLTTSRPAIPGSEAPGGFAMPFDAAIRPILDRLRDGKEVEYGFLGITTLSIEDHPSEGVVLDRPPLPGSPADGKLQQGSVILSINGRRVHNFEELSLVVGTLLAGSEARLELQEHSPVTVRLAKVYIPGKVIVSSKPAAPRGVRVDYTSVLYTQNPMAFRGQIPPGVCVREVPPGSKLKENEIVTHVDGHEVNTPDEFYDAAAKVPSGRKLKLTLLKIDWNTSNTTDIEID